MELKDIVSTRLAELGIGPVTAAKRSGLKENFIGDILKGRKQSVQLRNLTRLAEALHLDPVAMSRGDLVPLTMSRAASAPATPNQATVRILGKVAASYAKGTHPDQGPPVGTVPAPPALSGISGIYGLYVEGRSMEPQFFPGELIFVNAARPARIGDCAVIITDHGEGPQRSLGIFESETAETLTLHKHSHENGRGMKILIPQKYVKERHKVLTTNEMFGA